MNKWHRCNDRPQKVQGDVKQFASNRDPVKPWIYQIRIKGHLGNQWIDWFEGLTITLEEDGDTLLTGPVVDQAALHGLLKKVRDLGMPLVSVSPVEPGPTRSGQAGRYVKCQIGINRRRLVYAKINHNKEIKNEYEQSKFQGTNRKTQRLWACLFIIGTVSGTIGRRYWKTYPGCSGLSD